MVTLIRPNWLEVEKAAIFLISFWVSAQIAVNSVVIAPRHTDGISSVALRSLCSRICS